MKLLVNLAFAFVLSSAGFAASATDFVGTYSVVFDAGVNTVAVPKRYVVLHKDGSFIWGIDSIAKNPLQNSFKGTWSYTSNNEIKMIPAKNAPIHDIRFFVRSTNKRLVLRTLVRDGKLVTVKEADGKLMLVPL